MEILTKEHKGKKELAQERGFNPFVGMVFYSLLIATALLFSSCQKPMVHVYTYHWKEARTARWNQHNIAVDEILSEGEIEVYRQTEDNKVIQMGLTTTGVVWQSYITYCCSEEK